MSRAIDLIDLPSLPLTLSYYKWNFLTGVSAISNTQDGMIRVESMTINFVLRCVVMYCLTGGGHNLM